MTARRIVLTPVSDTDIVAGARYVVTSSTITGPQGASGSGTGGAVESVNGATGVVVLTAVDVGAATAAQGAKADTAVQPADLAPYATDADITALIGAAPAALDTLSELADALGDDANFAATVTTALAGKQPLDADLTAIAALVTTAYGRGFLTLADQAALVALLPSYQPLDADLTTLAGAGNSAVLAATTAAFATADETKLDGIEAGADVTDAANVAAAGALMSTDAPELIRDTIGTALVAGANVTITPNDVANTITVAASAGGVTDGDKGDITVTGGVWTIDAGVVTAAKVAADVATQAELDAVASAAVAKSLYNANTILAATTDDTPAPLTVGASTVVGRKATGGIAAMTPAETYALLTRTRELYYTIPGTLTTGGGAIRIPFARAATITNVAASINTAPTGASVIVDVNKNGTTIFTTQGNRPTIAVSTNADNTSTPDVTAIAANDYLTVDVDQIGSTVAGADLTVRIDYTEAG